ncbi:MAG: hypothetical protein BGO63_15285 [Candidatus Accumulibacter sp. 66-26]|nr:MAG: hypothetical protein BGO63_15285 [Candidatus Accumulibacter sp. 66-26]
MSTASQALKKHLEQGFTLFEMLLVIALIGILLLIADMGNIIRLNTTYYQARQEANNRKIAAALLQHARTNTTQGFLSNPYTGGGYYSTILDPSDTTLAQMFRSANLPPAELNSDGSSGANVRVYQTVTLTESIPLDFRSGPLTTITYQYGEVHLTACMLSNSCNRSPLPGASTALTAANYKTWTTTAPDLPPTLFSTREIQKQMLAATSERLAMIRDQAIARVNVRRLSADAADTTNWYPYSYATGAPTTPSPNMAGSDASVNQGCWDGWYQLNAANVNILPQLGLTAAQYGITAWGARIEYCRDYDPALRGANSLPHYAALRINMNVSQALPPNNTLQSDNLFITF